MLPEVARRTCHKNSRMNTGVSTTTMTWRPTARGENHTLRTPKGYALGPGSLTRGPLTR